MLKTIHHRAGLLFSSILLLMTLGASTASAGTSLDDIPAGFDTVVGVDFEELRNSPLYDQAIGMIRNQPMLASAIRNLESTLDLEVDSDLSSLMMVSNFPPLNQQMLSSPAAAIQGAAAGSGDSLALVSGDFDATAVLASLSEDYDGEGELAIDDRAMTLYPVGDQKLAVLFGSSEFRSTGGEQLSSAGGLGAEFEEGLRRVGGSPGLFVLTSPNIDDDELAEQADASFMALGLRADSSDIRIASFITLSDDERAEEMIEDVDKARNDAARNPLFTMFGLGPLLQNLSLQQDDNHVVMETSMPNQNALRLARRIANILENQMDLQQPLGDDGEREGVDADFN